MGRQARKAAKAEAVPTCEHNVAGHLVTILAEAKLLGDPEAKRESRLNVRARLRLRVRVEERNASAVQVARGANMRVSAEHQDWAARAVLGDEPRRGASCSERDDE